MGRLLSTKDTIDARFAALEQQGNELVRGIGRHQFGDGSDDYYAPQSRTQEYAGWLSAVANLLNVVATQESHYALQVEDLLDHPDMKHGVVTHVVKQVHGVLSAARQDWHDGLLRRIEFMVAASTFDDFLDQAELYLQGKKKVEAAVLAAAVLEDALKKVAVKSGVQAANRTLDPIIDDLVKAGTLTPVKAKRWKSFAGIRNKALHAEWDAFDLDDVTALIAGLREMLADYL